MVTVSNQTKPKNSPVTTVFLLVYVSRRFKKTLKAIKAGAPTVCMHAVSGSISLPSRGSFHLSLTVLVLYRSITSI